MYRHTLLYTLLVYIYMCVAIYQRGLYIQCETHSVLCIRDLCIGLSHVSPLTTYTHYIHLWQYMREACVHSGCRVWQYMQEACMYIRGVHMWWIREAYVTDTWHVCHVLIYVLLWIPTRNVVDTWHISVVTHWHDSLTWLIERLLRHECVTCVSHDTLTRTTCWHGSCTDSRVVNVQHLWVWCVCVVALWYNALTWRMDRVLSHECLTCVSCDIDTTHWHGSFTDSRVVNVQRFCECDVCESWHLNITHWHDLLTVSWVMNVWHVWAMTHWHDLLTWLVHRISCRECVSVTCASRDTFFVTKLVDVTHWQTSQSWTCDDMTHWHESLVSNCKSRLLKIIGLFCRI